MTYPDGTSIEGVFANNIYKGPEEPEKVILNPLAATKDLAEWILQEEQDDYGPKIYINNLQTPLKSLKSSSNSDFSWALST